MSMLAEVAAAVDPALREYAVPGGPPGRFNGSNGPGPDRAFVQAQGRPELAEELWQATTRLLSGGGGQGAREALSKAL